MWPREHGAYAQVTFPLLTAFLAAGPSPGGLLIAMAVVGGFVAHEPAAVLLGLRGPRARREAASAARRWLACAAALGAAAGVAALVAIDPGARWSVAIPLVPALLLAAAVVRGNEKSWLGETAAALAFSGTAVPVSLAAAAPLDTGLAVAVPFALLFVGSTLAVRTVILRVRGGGNAGAASATRRATLALAACGTIVVAAGAGTGVLARSVLMATAPALLTVAVLAIRPPGPDRLRAIGWTIVAVSVVTASIVIATA
jgi:hypothetical protein